MASDEAQSVSFFMLKILVAILTIVLDYFK